MLAIVTRLTSHARGVKQAAESQEQRRELDGTIAGGRSHYAGDGRVGEVDDPCDLVAAAESEDVLAVVEVDRFDDRARADRAGDDGWYFRGAMACQYARLTEIRERAGGVRADEAKAAGDEDHPSLPRCVDGVMIRIADDQEWDMLRR